jgi:peptide/nickel transport system substrate-binding protein
MLADRDVESLDPHDTGGIFQTQNVLANVYEGLIRRDGDMRLVPALATSWSNPDDLTWDFVLRGGVRFHDGTVMGADDVVASLLRARDRPGSARGALANVSQVTAMGPLLVRLRTREPDAALLSLLPQLHVASARWLQDPRGSASGGSGPYAVSAHRPGEAVELVHFPAHWRGDPPFAAVHVLAASFATPAAATLVPAGAPLTFYAVPGTPAFEQASSQYTLHERAGLSVQYLGFDLRDRDSPGVRHRGRGNPFRDVRVRRAVALAIDQEELREDVFGGRAPTAAQLVAPTVLGYDPTLPVPAQDLAQARRLMEESGFADGFEVDLDTRDLVARYVPHVVRDLGLVGIRARVRTLPEDAFFAHLRSGQSSLYLLRYSCRTGDAQELYDNVLHSRDEARQKGTFNFSAEQSPVPALDALIAGARRELDPSRRLGRLRQVMRIAMQEQLMVPLLSEQTIVFTSRGLVYRPRADALRLFAEMSPPVR